MMRRKRAVPMTDFCANCPVWKGACPDCGTFWIAKPYLAKRYGVRPTKHAEGPTTGCYALQTLPNVVIRDA